VKDDHPEDEETTMAVTDLAASDPVDPTGSAREPGPRLAPGDRVEVRTRLDAHRWGRGFVVASVEPDGYVVTRVSDGATMPVVFGFDDVRTERKRGTWWY
jgi:hypothetical protein